MNSSLNNRYQSTTFASLVAVAMVCAAAGTAGAQDIDGPLPLTKAVAFGDLNLDTAQGAKLLYARLRHAAEQVCSPFNKGGQLSLVDKWQTCCDNAITTAVAHINKTPLTALHNAQSHVAKDEKGG